MDQRVADNDAQSIKPPSGLVSITIKAPAKSEAASAQPCADESNKPVFGADKAETDSAAQKILI